ncbi:MAG: B12-binding domain-containing radical SAM protein [Bariatricus sp.]
MKILLTAINAKYIHSNLAVYSLKAYAEEQMQGTESGNDVRIEIAEYTINQQTDEILRDIYKRKPDMLCLSCYIWNLIYVEEIVCEIRKILPDVILWLGGPEVSYDAADVLSRLPEADGVIMGEGERTFAELLMHYQTCSRNQTEELSAIPGITYRKFSGGEWTKEIGENDWRPVMDLSEVPFVYHNMKDFENKIIYYESSRGCPFSCSYCLSSVDKCLRFRSLELVKKELQFLIDQKVPQVKFVDRTFNCRHDHAMAIWNYIMNHDNGITNFHFEVSADLLNEEELELMSRMRPGLIQLEIGVQSTNPETIREIHRTMRFEEVARIVKRINSFGNIHQHLDLIAGLPFEDYESFGRSFNDVYALQPEQLQLGFLKVLKGSYMEEHKEEYELSAKSLPPYEVLHTKWLPYDDTLRLKGIEEMVEVYYNSRQFCYTLPYIIRLYESPFAFFEKLSCFYEERGMNLVSHSRAARYEILLEFAKEQDPEHLEEYRQLMTLDYFLRENAKNRPEFAGEERISKEEEKEFYDQEAKEHSYLAGYEAYDRRQLRKMTHLEAFTFDVLGNMSPERVILLFDYQNRSPLNHQAAIQIIDKKADEKRESCVLQK